MSHFHFGYDPDVSRWTLREVRERGTLVFECRKCGRVSVLDADELYRRFRDHELVATVRARMYCRRCNTRRPDVLVHLNFGRKDLAWWPTPPRRTR